MTFALKKTKYIITIALLLTCFVVVGAMLGWRDSHSQKTVPAKQSQQILAMKIASPPLPEDTMASIPSGASPELTEFLQNRTTLVNNFAKLHNQMMQANLAGTGSGTAQDLAKLFHDQNEPLLKKQAELAHIIAQQQAQKPVPPPPPLVIPPDASPQMEAYLIARDQLTRDRIQTLNKYRTANRQAQQAAMQQWQHQNANRLQHLRDLAQALPRTNAPLGVTDSDGTVTHPQASPITTQSH